MKNKIKVHIETKLRIYRNLEDNNRDRKSLIIQKKIENTRESND